MKKYNVIVIGAGHNGLTNAAFLAKAGLSVLVVEKNPWIGDASVSRSLYPGWTYSNCSYVRSLFRPEIYRALELARHGLQVIPCEGSITFMRNGDYFGSYRDKERHYREMARHSRRDADAYQRYEAEVMRQARLIRPLLMRTPPDPASFRPKDLMELIHFIKSGWDLGEEALCDTIRFWTMSVGDFLDGYFESDIVKAHLAGSGIIGTALGVYSPGTAYVLLHHYMGDVNGSIGLWGFARGGMGAIAKALVGALQAHGGEVKVNAGVDKILVNRGRVRGVVLENGDEYHAGAVVSNLDPKRTFLNIMDERDLPEDLVNKARNFKIRGSSGKLNIALDGIPTFYAVSGDHELLSTDMHFIDSLERMEKAYDDWKNGTWSKDPYQDTLIPTLVDPTMAPPGKHTMSVFVQYCPLQVNGQEWTDEQCDQFGQTVIDQIAEYSPDFKDLILHAEVRTPRELEDEVGLTEGNIFQGEPTMDQMLFNWPFPGYAQYRGPVKGMYMCGSGTHPGGAVMGAPGANSAREILRDLGRNNVVPDALNDD